MTPTDNGSPRIFPKLLVVITDRGERRRLEDILREKGAHFHYMLNAVGTASSEILKTFGLSGSEKTVCVCVAPAVKARHIMTSVVERLEFTRPGNGIAFYLPISGLSAVVTAALGDELAQLKERMDVRMEKEQETAGGGEARFELVLALINQGFSDVLMAAARTAGARGGTIVHALRSGAEDAKRFLGISLQEEKELVAIITTRTHKKELMRALSHVCGANTDAQGIMLSLPVEGCEGIRFEEYA
ncbi:MAG: hypothetical protein LBD92_05880 [Oscillospiraceae bacterium]|jgi:hypothetical protein|nr:hypothetical protein [Oscillospiraceae bacterium]